MPRSLPQMEIEWCVQLWSVWLRTKSRQPRRQPKKSNADAKTTYSPKLVTMAVSKYYSVFYPSESVVMTRREHVHDTKTSLAVFVIFRILGKSVVLILLHFRKTTRVRTLGWTVFVKSGWRVTVPLTYIQRVFRIMENCWRVTWTLIHHQKQNSFIMKSLF